MSTEPLPFERADIHHGLHMSLVANIHRPAGSAPKDWRQFVIFGDLARRDGGEDGEDMEAGTAAAIMGARRVEG